MLIHKKALVTGGTAGIGKAIALAFAKQRASVVIFGTDRNRAETVLQEMERARQDLAQTFSFKLLDIADKKSVDVAIAEIGHIDILVNNAGITRDSLFMKMSEEDWDRVIAVNLKSVYNTSQALIRPMLKARAGVIINISSVVALMGNPGQANYIAAKAGVIGITKALAKEVASRNIRVNCIAPGFIQTAMTEALTEPQKEGILKQIPMGRIGLAEEIANVALFLASPLSSYITGQVITVDGGMCMY